IAKVGSGYTLSASDSGLTGATSSSFAITVGAASQVVFTNAPALTTAGQVIDAPTGVQVSVEDSAGNVVTTDSSSVTVAIGTGSPSTTLNGTLTVQASGGVATFTNLSISTAGNGYTLTAGDPGLSGATSSSFSLVVGGATHL